MCSWEVLDKDDIGEEETGSEDDMGVITIVWLFMFMVCDGRDNEGVK